MIPRVTLREALSEARPPFLLMRWSVTSRRR